MSRFVVDTSFVSMLAPERKPIGAEADSWAKSTSHLWVLPTVVVMELQQGVQKLIRQGATRKSDMYANWLDGLLRAFSDRVADFDLMISRRAGIISDRLFAAGKHPGFTDVMIAATADVRGMTVLTRNVRHFEATGVTALDPFTLSAGK